MYTKVTNRSTLAFDPGLQADHLCHWSLINVIATISAAAIAAAATGVLCKRDGAEESAAGTRSRSFFGSRTIWMTSVLSRLHGTICISYDIHCCVSLQLFPRGMVGAHV